MTDTPTPSRLSKITRRIFLFLLIGILYAVTSVPVGLFIYSLKSDLGINVFSKTGYHSYVQCLRQEAYKAAIREKQKKPQ